MFSKKWHYTVFCNASFFWVSNQEISPFISLLFYSYSCNSLSSENYYLMRRKKTLLLKYIKLLFLCNIVYFIISCIIPPPPQVSIHVAVAHQTSHLEPDTQITTILDSQLPNSEKLTPSLGCSLGLEY